MYSYNRWIFCVVVFCTFNCNINVVSSEQIEIILDNATYIDSYFFVSMRGYKDTFEGLQSDPICGAYVGEVVVPDSGTGFWTHCNSVLGMIQIDLSRGDKGVPISMAIVACYENGKLELDIDGIIHEINIDCWQTTTIQLLDHENVTEASTILIVQTGDNLGALDKITLLFSDPPDPTEDPSPPTTDPDDPTEDPSPPTTDPDDPTEDPSPPTTDPDDPTEDPSPPTTDPDDPTEDPSPPTTDPGDPTDDPTTTEPAVPTSTTTEPSGPSTTNTEPTGPSKTTTEPTGPTSSTGTTENTTPFQAGVSGGLSDLEVGLIAFGSCISVAFFLFLICVFFRKSRKPEDLVELPVYDLHQDVDDDYGQTYSYSKSQYATGSQPGGVHEVRSPFYGINGVPPTESYTISNRSVPNYALSLYTGTRGTEEPAILPRLTKRNYSTME